MVTFFFSTLLLLILFLQVLNILLLFSESLYELKSTVIFFCL